MTRRASWSTCSLPPRLRPGDTIAVPAPAGPVNPDRFRAGLAVLATRYKVIHDEGVLSRQGFLAGPDDRRIEELNRYLGDPDVRAIACARGGYGIMRILDKLDAAALKREPKVVMGFSDATALLAWCAAAAQLRPVHGPVVTQLGDLPGEDLAWLFRMLEETSPPGELPGPLSRVGDRGGGTVDGRLVGGNLEMCTRLVDTPWEMDFGAAVGFFEDVGERPYRLDWMLTQLSLAGAFDGLRAVLLGDFVRCEDPDGAPPSANEVLDERLASFQIPAVAGAPFGHGPRNLALPVGALCAVNLGEARVVLEEPAVG